MEPVQDETQEARRRRLRIRYWHEEPESLLDHVVAGTLSALVMGITVAIGPLIVGIKAAKATFGGRRGVFYLYHGFTYWATALVVLAFAVGIVVGPKRVVSLFGHLWGTEDPYDPRVSATLWASVIAIVVVSWWLAGPLFA